MTWAMQLVIQIFIQLYKYIVKLKENTDSFVQGLTLTLNDIALLYKKQKSTDDMLRE
mgnify:CR=1 FL=1